MLVTLNTKQTRKVCVFRTKRLHVRLKLISTLHHAIWLFCYLWQTWQIIIDQRSNMELQHLCVLCNDVSCRTILLIALQLVVGLYDIGKLVCHIILMHNHEIFKTNTHIWLGGIKVRACIYHCHLWVDCLETSCRVKILNMGLVTSVVQVTY